MKHTLFSVLLAGMLFLPASADARVKPGFELFMASAEQILPGEKVTLAWRVEGATKCQLRDNTDGKKIVLMDGLSQYVEQDLYPTRTTVYQVYCTRMKYDDGRASDKVVSSAERSIKIAVKKTGTTLPNALAPTCALQAIDQSKNHQLSGSAKLKWTSENAKYGLITVDYAHGFDVHMKKRFKPKGTMVHRPQQSATYRLTVFGDGGQASCETEVARKA